MLNDAWGSPAPPVWLIDEKYKPLLDITCNVHTVSHKIS